MGDRKLSLNEMSHLYEVDPCRVCGAHGKKKLQLGFDRVTCRSCGHAGPKLLLDGLPMGGMEKVKEAVKLWNADGR